jgi:polar amino acid transport system permease protein
MPADFKPRRHPTKTLMDSHNPSQPVLPGSRQSKLLGRADGGWALVVGVILLIILLVTIEPDPFMRIVRFVSDGIGVTLLTTVISFVLVLVVGLIGGLGRISHTPILRGIATVYVEVIRGVPLLVQLLFWYFAFPSVVQRLGDVLKINAFSNYLANPLAMAILGLTFCYGAYMSEVYRAGIQSISKGQMEAARSLGMTYFQAMRHVILPQAIRVIMPPVGNEFISLLKDSSLVSVVAVEDITKRGREFSGAQFIALETWIMVALIYLVMTLLSARVVTYIERRSSTER